tara:strand:- start:471 stop:689 length:219 start_codon:yes stop_codon:yes gene_type:complete
LKNRNEEAAFPVPIGQTDERQWGMSLRDWFAGKAMQAKLISGDWNWMHGGGESASDCYDLAEAMMKAREAKQ